MRQAEKRYSTLMKYRKNILVTIIIASFGLIVFKACSNDIDFDSKKWKNWSELNEKDWNLRWDMTDDLIDNHLKKGMSIREVTKLLGGKVFSSEKKFTMHYNLGPCRRGIDYGSLEILFLDGKLESVKKNCN